MKIIDLIWRCGVDSDTRIRKAANREQSLVVSVPYGESKCGQVNHDDLKSQVHEMPNVSAILTAAIQF